jgi:hypothetical protein
MAAALPPYDLALDEMSVALSYILLSSGASIPPVAASAVPAQAAAPIAPKKEVPKKVRHKLDVSFFCFYLLCRIILFCFILV